MSAIKIRYSSIDGVLRMHSFKTLKGAQAFAHRMIGEHPELGRCYAVSGDGIGKIVPVAGVTLAELFPPRADQLAAELSEREQEAEFERVMEADQAAQRDYYQGFVFAEDRS